MRPDCPARRRERGGLEDCDADYKLVLAQRVPTVSGLGPGEPK